MIRSLVAVIVIALAGCSSGTSGLPAALAPLAETAQVTPFTGWSIPGLTMYRACSAMPDRSTCSVLGVAPDGALLRGPELFRRLPPDTSALDLARRAHDLLLGEAGQEPLRPADRAEGSTFVSEQEWSVITDPAFEGDALVFFTMEGEMDPTATRYRVDRATGALTRESAFDVWTAQAPPGPASCEPLAICGCDRGCVRVDVLRAARRADVLRELDGPRRGTRYYRASTGFLHTMTDEPCRESCPTVTPTYRCELEGDACERVAL